MVWHVHFKDKKFAIWSTFVDAYVTAWHPDPLFIVGAFQGRAAAEAKKIADTKIERAMESFCSELKPFRCEPEEVESG